ncbi:MAG: sialidase family protein [Pseudomonadota bacterium]|nr:sialidase family protein [Pseudomonadota bacterium]
MRLIPYVLLALLAACTGEEEKDEATHDVKVDHNAKEDAIESIVPRSCFTNGRLAVAWQDDRDGVPGIWFNASADTGATWMTADVKLDIGEVGAFAPDIACSGDSIYVVWEDERDGDLRYRNIYVNVSSDGGRTWLEADVRLDGDIEGEAMSLGPRVVAAGDSAYVAWFDSRDGAYDIYVQATRDGGATWLEAPTRVDTDAAGEAYSAWPRLAADDDGRVVVTWEDSRAGASDIYANVSTDGGESFGAEDARLDGGEEGGESNSFLPSLAMAGGNAYVVWHDERNGDNRDVYVNASSDGGESWQDEPSRVDSDAAGQSDAINPVVAAVGDRVHIAWQDDRSGGYDIYHRFSRDGGAEWAAEEVRMDRDAGGESQSFEPTLLVQGDAVLVGWEDRRADGEEVGFNDLYYNYSEDGGQNWSLEDLRINSNAQGSAYAFDLGLALVDGGIVAVWADGRYGSSDIFCANRALGEASRYVAPPEPAEGSEQEAR